MRDRHFNKGDLKRRSTYKMLVDVAEEWCPLCPAHDRILRPQIVSVIGRHVCRVVHELEKKMIAYETKDIKQKDSKQKVRTLTSAAHSNKGRWSRIHQNRILNRISTGNIIMF